jgi:signal transduction histidine kinase
MLFVTVILIVAFGAVGTASFVRLERNSRNVLESFADRSDMMEGEFKQVHEIGAPPGDKKELDNFTVFTVQLDSNNKIAKLMGENIEISDAVLNQIITTCLERDKSSGVIWNTSLRYLIHETDSEKEIIFYDLSNDISTMIHLVKNCLLVGIGSLLAFFLISVYLARWALRPVEKSWESQRQFIADASHELKTPLTVILANVDILNSHKEDTIENQHKWIEYIRAEASHMSGLVNDLLFLAKSDASRENVVLSETNLSDIVWNCYLPFESVAFEQEKMLDAEIEPDIMMKGDAGKLKQLVMILLDNACKYTEKNGSIKVTLYKKAEKDKVYLTVNNSGAVITPENIEHLFERFYRAEESRAREMGGYGLGLSIAKTITEMHHGKISVTSTKEEGTTFCATFHLSK